MLSAGLYLKLFLNHGFKDDFVSKEWRGKETSLAILAYNTQRTMQSGVGSGTNQQDWGGSLWE